MLGSLGVVGVHNINAEAFVTKALEFRCHQVHFGAVVINVINNKCRRCPLREHSLRLSERNYVRGCIRVRCVTTLVSGGKP